MKADGPRLDTRVLTAIVAVYHTVPHRQTASEVIIMYEGGEGRRVSQGHVILVRILAAHCLLFDSY